MDSQGRSLTSGGGWRGVSPLVRTTKAAAQSGSGGPGLNFSPSSATLAQKVAGLFSPFTLFDGVRRWIGGSNSNPADNVPYPGGFGVVYVLVLLALTAACLAGLFARYRKKALQS